MKHQQLPRVRTRILGGVSKLALASAFAVAQSLSAFASLTNTVTVSGTGPTGAITPEPTDSVSLPVVTADPKLKIVKTWAFKTANSDDGDNRGDAGEIVVYTYTVTNTGNVTINDVSVNDTHDGTGALAITHAAAASSTNSSDATASANIAVWGALVPGDSIVFSAEYQITASDILTAGGGTTPDGNLDNSAVPAGTYVGNPASPSNTPASIDPTSTGTAQVPLDITSTLTVAKTAVDGTGNPIAGPVSAGTVITYRYVVTNTGNTPVNSVSLAESFNGTGGSLTPALVASPLTDNGTLGDSTDNGTDQVWDVLGPGDAVTYQTTYTVTQTDVDQLQ